MKKSRLLIAGSAISLAVFSAIPSYAQEASEEAPAAQEEAEEDEGEPILVTGSRIARPESSGVIAGVQVEAEQITTRGFTNALEALNDIPLVGPGADG
jgi:hypothetical protein